MEDKIDIRTLDLRREICKNEKIAVFIAIDKSFSILGYKKFGINFNKGAFEIEIGCLSLKIDREESRILYSEINSLGEPKLKTCIVKKIQPKERKAPYVPIILKEESESFFISEKNRTYSKEDYFKEDRIVSDPLKYIIEHIPGEEFLVFKAGSSKYTIEGDDYWEVTLIINRIYDFYQKNPDL